MLLLRSKVNLGAMAIKGYFAYPKLGPRHKMFFSYLYTRWVGGFLPLCWEIVGVFYSHSRLGLKWFRVIYVKSGETRGNTWKLNTLICLSKYPSNSCALFRLCYISLFAFHTALIPTGKQWTQISPPQLLINIKEDCALNYDMANHLKEVKMNSNQFFPA